MSDIESTLIIFEKMCIDSEINLLLWDLREARELYDTTQEDYSLGATMHTVVDCVKAFIEEPTPRHYLSLIQSENMMLGVLLGKGVKSLFARWGGLWDGNRLLLLRDALEVAVAENAYLFDFKFPSYVKFDDFDCI